MDSSQKKILIIEDDQFLREFYQELLQSEGFSVDVAADGEVAQTKVIRGGYDLILLDIMLPKKDGLEILRTLRITPSKQAKAPIVILTNLGQDTVIKEAFALGAAGYIIKSALNPDEVLQEIKTYLQKGNES